MPAPTTISGGQPTKADIESMTYPITGPDGNAFDQAIEVFGVLDDMYDACPSWCEDADSGHRHVEGADSDRAHFGERIGVRVRSIKYEPEFKGEPLKYVMGTMQMYLSRYVLHREPTIWVGQGESGDGVSLSMTEARTIAETLLRLAEEGQR